MDHKDLAEQLIQFAKSQAGCLGIAAIQVGYPFKLMVFRDGPQGDFITCFNPHYFPSGPRTAVCAEECLTYPGQSFDVRRAVAVEAYWNDFRGYGQYRKLMGLAARVFQHETDHCNGITIKMIGEEEING
jgi:peptide deformylase